MSNPNNLAAAADQDFKESGRDELEVFAEMLGVSFHPNIGDRNLRNRLLEKLGKKVHEFPGQPTDDQLAELAADIGMGVAELYKLNLSPYGKWEGRRREIQITRPSGWKGNQPHPFRWSHSMTMVPFNVAVSVPYPVYQIAKNAVYNEVRQIREQAADGTGRIRNVYDTFNRFNLTDLRDDPSTAHLPVSQTEQFRRIAELTDMLGKFGRRELVLMARRLRLRFPKDDDDQGLRDRILSYLGYDIELGFSSELVA